MGKVRSENEKRAKRRKFTRNFGIMKSREKNGTVGYKLHLTTPFDSHVGRFQEVVQQLQNELESTSTCINVGYDDITEPETNYPHDSFFSEVDWIQEGIEEEEDTVTENEVVHASPSIALYNQCRINELEGSAVIMAFLLRFNLPFNASSPLIHTINSFLPTPCLKSSQFKFYQKYQSQMNQIKRYHFCHQCKTFLGTNIFGSLSCLSCKCLIVSSTMYYAQLSLKSQLESFFSYSSWYEHVSRNENQEQDGVMRDIQDGEKYQELKQQVKEPFITLTICTDGVQVLKSNNHSMWPVLVIINELPASVRYRSIFLSGIWYGDEKVPLNSILHLLTEDVNGMSRNGLTFNFKENRVKLKVYVLAFIADSAAKYKLQGLTQYNGTYGCTCCYIRVQKIQNKMVFLYGNGGCGNRTHSDYLKDVETFMIHGSSLSRGINFLSPISLLENFKITEDFTIDQLHAVYIGVVKRLTTLWLSSESKKQPFYIGHKKKLINKRIQMIKPPAIITRRPESIDSMANWKANQWRVWLLYYAVPVLHGILPSIYLVHFAKLSACMHILLAREIPKAILNIVEKKMENFVFNCEMLYGPQTMVYNIHLMLHLVAAVRRFGPLWSISMFPFETYNRVVSNFVVGSRHSQLQVMKKYILLQWLISATPDLSGFVQHTIRNILKKYAITQKIFESDCDRIYAIGNGSSKNFTVEIDNQQCDISKEYQKLVIDSITFSTSEYDTKFQKHNHTIVLKNKTFAKIQRICCAANSKFVMLVNIYNALNYYVAENEVKFLKVLRSTDQTLWIWASDVESICVCMDFGANKVVSIPPNTIEMD